MSANLSVAVPKQAVKQVKDLLKQQGQLDRQRKIQAWDGQGHSVPLYRWDLSNGIRTLDTRTETEEHPDSNTHGQDTRDFSKQENVPTTLAPRELSTTYFVIPTTIPVHLSKGFDPSEPQQSPQKPSDDTFSHHIRAVLGSLQSLSLQSTLASQSESPIYIILPDQTQPQASSSSGSAPPSTSTTNLLVATIETWLRHLPQSLLDSIQVTPDQLRPAIPKTYTIYHPMLLLPAHAFRGDAWQRLLWRLHHTEAPESKGTRGDLDTDPLRKLYRNIATAMGVTHIATNGAIPLGQDPTQEGKISQPGSLPLRGLPQDQDHNTKTQTGPERIYQPPDSGTNILRTPSALQPLYGDFGPVLSSSSSPPPSSQPHITPPPARPLHTDNTTPPLTSDLDAAFWVSTRQHGIYQTWAPRYTMFSRGNIREKARLRNLLAALETGCTFDTEHAVLSDCSPARTPSTPAAKAVLKPVSNLKLYIPPIPPSSCTAVDLYAGIGYFTFSYAAAGITKVLGWELNPWSVEGLRRGACGNGWSVDVSRPGSYPGSDSPDNNTPTLTNLNTPTTNTHTHDPTTEMDIRSTLSTRISAFCEDNARAVQRIDILKQHRLRQLTQWTSRPSRPSQTQTQPIQEQPRSRSRSMQYLPPIRHVNLGLLPSSRASWESAVRILDLDMGLDCAADTGAGVSTVMDAGAGTRVSVEYEEYEHEDGCEYDEYRHDDEYKYKSKHVSPDTYKHKDGRDHTHNQAYTTRQYRARIGLGGFLHIHENIATRDIPRITGEIVLDIAGIVQRLDHSGAGAGTEPDTGPDRDTGTGTGSTSTSTRIIACTHVERVKTYAPGVMHCVVDVYISPRLG